MKLIKNTGNDRVMDALRAALTPAAKLDIATPAFSVFAFAEFASLLQSLSACRLLLPVSSQSDLQLLGSDADRTFRNQLTARWLARQCADWISHRVEVRNNQTGLPQPSPIANDAAMSRAITGHWLKQQSPTEANRKARNTVCVFRDSAFADDVAKTNLTAILRQHGLENVRSL